MTDLYNYSLLTIFLVGLSMIWSVSEIGDRLGKRAATRGGDDVSTLETAVLGLLALIIGFTFAMALERFDARRDAIMNEANAIGTTALRARLLPEPQRTESMKLLQEYVKIRVNVSIREVSLKDMIVKIDRSNAIQEALWQQAMAVAAKDKGMVPTGLYIEALNEMIDNQGKRLAALRNRVPAVVLLSLFALASVAGGFAGYGSGLDARRNRLPVYINGLLIAFVILLILDLDRPNSGFITVSQQPMIDAAASIAAFTD